MAVLLSGRPAETGYRVLGAESGLSLLLLTPVTDSDLDNFAKVRSSCQNALKDVDQRGMRFVSVVWLDAAVDPRRFGGALRGARPKALRGLAGRSVDPSRGGRDRCLCCDGYP